MIVHSLITLALLLPTTAFASAGNHQSWAWRAARADSPLNEDLLFLERQEAEVAAPGTGGPERTRDFLMEINFRGRYLTLPDGLLDIWYYDEGDDGVTMDRPKVRAWGVGLEWWARWETGACFTVFFDYLGHMIDEGYWDDVEEPANHHDGEYLVPSRLGIIDFGFGPGYEAKITPWMGFMFWGGLGPLFLTGEFDHWVHGSNAENDPYCEQGDGTLSDPVNSPAYERYAAGCGSDGAKRIPSVLGVVDLVVALHFDFNQRANLRIEGGIHDLPFVGMATGVTF